MNPTTQSVSEVEIPPGYLNIMGYVDESEVNGPGCRAVVWVQGCKRECAACFNPASWSFEINQLIAVDELAEKILSNPRNEGVTFSGGEPFLQAPALAQLAKKLKAAGLNVMSFSGYTLPELQGENAPAGARELLAELDNQRVRVLNPAFEDKITWASDQVEIHIFKDGSRLITGFRGQMGLSE